MAGTQQRQRKIDVEDGDVFVCFRECDDHNINFCGCRVMDYPYYAIELLCRCDCVCVGVFYGRKLVAII